MGARYEYKCFDRGRARLDHSKQSIIFVAAGFQHKSGLDGVIDQNKGGVARTVPFIVVLVQNPGNGNSQTIRYGLKTNAFPAIKHLLS
jgi:hypothetical protein